MKDYNTALEETPDEADIESIPDRPCPPSKPADFYGNVFYAYDGVDFTAADAFDGNGSPVAYRVNQNPDGDANEWTDSQRYGYSNTYPAYNDSNDSAEFSTGFSGHTFGLLGTSYDKDAGAYRFAADDTATHWRQYMQVSVFPLTDDDFLAASKSVVITGSVAAAADFSTPSPSSAPTSSYEEITGASALVASTLALGTLAYTLF